MLSAPDTLLLALVRHAAKPALRANGQTLRYADIAAAIAERVALLDSLGAQRVALALDNGIDWVLWDLALLCSDRVCVPLPGFFAPGQQRHAVDSAGVDTVIAAPGWDALFAGFGFSAVQPGILQRAGFAAPALPAGTCKITYTSGTTGQPKGVCLDAEALFAVARSLTDASAECAIARHLCVLPLATLLENIAGVHAPLLAGACVDVPPLEAVGLKGASGFDVARFIACLHDSRPNSVILLPQLLLGLVMAAERGAALPDSLRFIAVGGGRVAPQLLERADALGLPVFEGYGLSECASVVCLNTPQARRIGTVGRALPHAELRLADDGEVLVRGARMRGYLGEPEEAQADGWWCTGDLGHFDGDFLVLHGRKKHQFVTAYGRNVNPEWVESELTQHGAIAQAWLYGEALAENLAVLVPRDPACSDADLAVAVASINATLPDYARAHRVLRAEQAFTPANGLATANGRLRRAALRAHYHAAVVAIAASTGAPTDTDNLHHSQRIPA